MLTLDELKDKLRKRLIDLEGHVEPADLEDIIEEAKELGLADEQIGRLVPEIDRTINWEHIRLEKEKAIEAAAIEAERQAKRQEEIDSAPEYLDALISYCMADGIVEEAELRVIFEKAKNLEQSLHAIAVKIKGLLDKGRFRPYPNANLNADGLHEVLMSTSWYTDKTHPQAQQQASASAQSAPPPPPLRIETFSVDKAQIKKGQFAKLSWNVSGKGRINISNLGGTETLVGEQIVRPLVTTRYTLTAGSTQQSVDVVVKTTPVLKQVGKVILWVIGIFFALGILVAILDSKLKVEHGDEASVSSSATSASQLSVGNTNAENLSSSEEASIVEQMNQYLRYQSEDYQDPASIRAICNQYAYPMARYFSKTNATEDYVYEDALRYRKKYKPDTWKIVPESTKLKRTPEGYYTIDLEGMFSYYIRNPKKGNGYRERYVHNHFLMNPGFKIMSVYEVK
jgi:hypothetical protein